MYKLLKIKEAAELLRVTTTTLRRWEKAKKLIPQRTKGGQRRYEMSQINPHLTRQIDSNVKKIKTIAYARVSSADQKEDLERQKKILEMYCAAQGWQFEVIADLGSGMNYHKKGLKKLLYLIFDGDVGRLVLTHKDRLLRFGSELIFALCELKNIEVVIINQGDEPGFEEELAKDVLEIITVFSARLYGSRSRKNKKLIEDLQSVANAASA